MTSAEDMWKVVKADTTMRSTLYLLDAEDQLCSMKLSDNDDSKAHHNELKQHLQLMLQRCDNLIKMGSTLSDTQFNTLIMSSLPESYWPTLQTITASERASKLIGGQSQQMKPDDLIAFLIEEAQHQVINDECTKNAKTALAAHGKRSGEKGARKGKKPRKSQRSEAEEVCKNCEKPEHKKPDCWSKGGGKEGKGPRQKKKSNKTKTMTIAADKEDNDMFAFVCTSDYVAVAETLQLPKSNLGTCINSGATQVYSPDCFKFSNYRPIDRDITTADGQIVKAVGVGDLELELPNGSEWTRIIFMKAVHAPGLAFTLTSISKLDKASYLVLFNEGMCKIKDPKRHTIATIPHSEGLYHITNPINHANAASGRLTISKAHWKLGHILHSAIKNAVMKGYITGIKLENDLKPEFCNACAKAKSARQPFPKESQTWATKYGERVHWDLWGPASVKSLNRHHYVATHIDDAIRETMLYFQNKKSQTFNSYKRDEAYIETQTGNRIKTMRCD
jgi:gag-polypeptide of LTR copia-type